MSVFKAGFVIFPDLTRLDFTGPLQVLARLPDSALHIVAKTLDPVPSDSGLSLMPTHTFSDCPPCARWESDHSRRSYLWHRLRPGGGGGHCWRGGGEVDSIGPESSPCSRSYARYFWEAAQGRSSRPVARALPL